jgi:hypothetical protein
LVLVADSITLPHEFFTIQSMLTFGGATTATFVITNAIYRATSYSPKWLGLVIAVVLTTAGVYYSHGQGLDYVAGLVNGCLVYLAAAGGTAAGAAATEQGGGTRARVRASGANPPRRFLEPWF